MRSSDHAGVPDEALLCRVQHDNQQHILGKLLHDLRNPIHSIQISMELFGRLARGQGDLDKLVARAAAYIGPAEAALETLLANSARLSRYLASPGPAAIAPVVADELLAEIAFLLRASKRHLQVTHAPAEETSALTLAADRARLSHTLIHRCLSQEAAAVSLSVRVESDQLVCIEAACDSSRPAQPGTACGPAPLTENELRLLIDNAGGALTIAPEGSLLLRFSRSSPANPPAR